MGANASASDGKEGNTVLSGARRLSSSSRKSPGATRIEDVDTTAPVPPGRKHLIKGTPLHGPWPKGTECAMFGMGCFWCSENLYMKLAGVYSTQVGYAGGSCPDPNYQDVSYEASVEKHSGQRPPGSGEKGHAEVVRVVFDPSKITYMRLLQIFWESHNPMTPNKQGRDEGSQYRSLIGCYNGQQKLEAETTKKQFEFSLQSKAAAVVTTVCTLYLVVPFFVSSGDAPECVRYFPLDKR
eukprot:TRINITY_DN24020_c0_g1_i1.p1 TRINITY_DN24020_c0_g1~~TRINITY_DN24020_c0_g1_i1.p1  ORF type:complete len:255 (+),score=36.88 TRINITY_DN24020_c0_g1_i1:49-765(+)